MEFLILQATRIDYGRIYLQTILEEEEPSTSPAVDEKQAARTTKVRTLLSTLRLTFYLVYHILSNMSWSSFSLSDASYFLRGVLPLFNLPQPQTEHLCITCEKKEKLQPYSMNLFLLCTISSKSVPYLLTRHCLEVGYDAGVI